jgi:hypothetical protein
LRISIIGREVIESAFNGSCIRGRDIAQQNTKHTAAAKRYACRREIQLPCNGVTPEHAHRAMGHDAADRF